MLSLDKRTFLIAGVGAVAIGAYAWYFRKVKGNNLAVWILAGAVGGALIDTTVKIVFNK